MLVGATRQSRHSQPGGAFSVIVKLRQTFVSSSIVHIQQQHQQGPGHVVHNVYLHCVIILVHIRYSSSVLRCTSGSMALRWNNIKALRYKQIGIFITNIRVWFFTCSNIYAYLHINIYTRTRDTGRLRTAANTIRKF